MCVCFDLRLLKKKYLWICIQICKVIKIMSWKYTKCSGTTAAHTLLLHRILRACNGKLLRFCVGSLNWLFINMWLLQHFWHERSVALVLVCNLGNLCAWAMSAIGLVWPVRRPIVLLCRHSHLGFIQISGAEKAVSGRSERRMKCEHQEPPKTNTPTWLPVAYR